MLHEFSNLIQLQKHFINEKICVDYLENLRWEGKPKCPKCGCEKIYRFATRLKHPDLAGCQDFACSNKACAKKFSVLTDSIFSGSKIELQVWFAAIYLISSHKKGISSHQLGKDLGITQKTAWFVLHRVRESFTPEPVTKKIDGFFAADEVFVGGENKYRHEDKKKVGTQGRSVKDKTPVLGIMQTGGLMRTQVIPNTQADTLQPIIKDLVATGAIIVTDDWGGYSGLSKDFCHVVVNHQQGEYARGGFSSNNVENFWSLFNRGIYGIYHHVSVKHLNMYCNEFQYRFNLRKTNDITKFKQTMFCTNHKRLTYKNLIGKPNKPFVTVDADGVGGGII